MYLRGDKHRSCQHNSAFCQKTHLNVVIHPPSNNQILLDNQLPGQMLPSQVNWTCILQSTKT